MASVAGYELLDCGDGRRLERFGGRRVDRPAPVATRPRRAPGRLWDDAALRFDRRAGWTGDDRSAWTVELDDVRLELRPGAAGQLGVYPEHATFWPWLRDLLDERPGASVLHLFAATGATTIALAANGAEVTHVDGARSAVAWARHNAELSGVANRPIRWIADDALGFTRREARRGRRYGGIILDPPTYGHAGGSRWTFDSGLFELLEAIVDVAADEAFVLLTAHATGLDPGDLGAALARAFGDAVALTAEPIELVATSGALLRLGAAARMIRR
jgi:23S rRNA (cytosine1962-C5)-methyltransferase